MNHYQILGLPRNASREQIRAAYEIGEAEFLLLRAGVDLAGWCDSAGSVRIGSDDAVGSE